MPRRSSGFNRVSAPRRRKGWEGGPGGTALQGVGSSSSVILGLGAELLLDGTTLLRLRGQVNVNLGTGAVLGDGFQGAFGIGIVQASAFAIGVTAVPTPLTEQDWDGWIFWSTLSVHTGDVSEPARSPQSTQVIDVDTKAMRKLDLQDTLYGVIEVVEIGTATMDVFFDSRLLLALP